MKGNPSLISAVTRTTQKTEFGSDPSPRRLSNVTPWDLSYSLIHLLIHSFILYQFYTRPCHLVLKMWKHKRQAFHWRDWSTGEHRRAPKYYRTIGPQIAKRCLQRAEGVPRDTQREHTVQGEVHVCHLTSQCLRFLFFKRESSTSFEGCSKFWIKLNVQSACPTADSCRTALLLVDLRCPSKPCSSLSVGRGDETWVAKPTDDCSLWLWFPGFCHVLLGCVCVCVCHCQYTRSAFSLRSHILGKARALQSIP